MEKVTKRFLDYVKYNTQSDDESCTTPSTPGQLEFARKLGKELKELGLSEVEVDNKGYLMATLPANTDEGIPVIGFIAHMDTSQDMSGKNVNPQIIEDYDGGNVTLNKEKGIVLSPDEFPSLKQYRGKTLITTDGTTLLGADNKAGVAEIITAVEYLLNNPEIPHGKIRIGFTPDEEIGRGADHFDVGKFGASFAYTVDGGPLGELEYENFNAAGARITINGVSIHPGTAKDKMVNSMLLATELINSLPAEETPTHTEGYQGFYHLVNITGNVEQTKLYYIIRDFDKIKFIERKSKIEELVRELNRKYGQGTVEIKLKDQYYNMKEKIEDNKFIVDLARQAMEAVGVKPLEQPIRGGTDGARLSYMGLPTPNIFTGGHNFHGKFEYIPSFAMEKAVEVIVKIIEMAGNIMA